MDNAGGLSESCQRAQELGDRLLSVLQGAVGDEMLTQLEGLVRDRAELLQAISRQLDATARRAAEPPLMALLAQQQDLEARLREQMAGLAQTARQSQVARASMDQFQRLLRSEGQSRKLDRRR